MLDILYLTGSEFVMYLVPFRVFSKF